MFRKPYAVRELVGGSKGLMLETQDLNLAACRFYVKTGFRIGGADTLLYEGLGTELAEERAIFWYKIF